MKKDTRVLIDIKFIGQKVIEIEVKNVSLNINSVKDIEKRVSKYYLKIKENCLYGNSKNIKLKRLVMVEDDILKNIKDVLFKPLKNIQLHNVNFKRTLLDTSNYAIYKKALIELGLNLSKVNNIELDGILSIEANGFRRLVEYNIWKGR